MLHIQLLESPILHLTVAALRIIICKRLVPHFDICETLHNEIKCVLNVKESNLNRKKEEHFHICLRPVLTVKCPFFFWRLPLITYLILTRCAAPSRTTYVYIWSTSVVNPNFNLAECHILRNGVERASFCNAAFKEGYNTHSASYHRIYFAKSKRHINAMVNSSKNELNLVLCSCVQREKWNSGTNRTISFGLAAG